MKRILLLSFSFFIGATLDAQTVGLFQNTPQSFNGYTMFSSMFDRNTYLIDNCGKEVHTWTSLFPYSRSSVYLLPGGEILRSGNNNSSFPSTSASGTFEKLDWNSNVLWSYVLSDTTQSAHHDFTVMPNGNVLAAVWEVKTPAELIAHGRNPASISGNLWPDKIVEISPLGKDSAAIVWEWSAWDHMIQDFSASANNFGVVSDHPELIDVNLVPSSSGSWMHVNSVDYDPTLDQIIFSVRNFSEFMVIDHSTTTAEAAGHTGGKRGKGGDILYRWGNPANYGRGTATDRQLFQQHDAKWIKAGLPRAGEIMVFNNGIDRPGTDRYTTVEIIRPPLMPDMSYELLPNQPFGPSSSDWMYPPQPDTSFYSATMGSASMQPNGNVLICEATLGEFWEVDSAGSVVWEYKSPLTPNGPLSQGSTGNTGVFKIARYAPNHPGLAGQTLTPGQPIELNPDQYNCTIHVVDNVADLAKRKSKIEVYPNPASDLVTIQLDTDAARVWTISLMDMTGRVLSTKGYSASKGANKVILDVSGYSKGCYLIKGTTQTEKVQRTIILN